MRLLKLSLLATATACRYLIVRHGETDHNAQGIIQGSSDVSRLTAKGQEQARLAGTALAAEADLTVISRVYVSSLSRARQTLEALADSSGLPLPDATVLSELREIDLGSWEGRQKKELQQTSPSAYAAWKHDAKAFAVDDTRPVVDLWARARSAWDVGLTRLEPPSCQSHPRSADARRLEPVGGRSCERTATAAAATMT